MQARETITSPASEGIPQNDILLTGSVVDDAGAPVVGAFVYVKNTTTGVSTDLDGNYSLSAPADATICVSCIGYLSQEIVLNGQSILNIVLHQDTSLLDEVVVVGYGVQKKVNLTGAVSAITSDELSSRPITNTSVALQGLLPGVTAIQNSGQPGKDNATVYVRGVGTLNTATPMYIVDGMPVSTINDIDANDIASISVLKDAASAAIYGSRAANGVILVTTKKGGSKEPTVRYDGYIGIQNPTAMQEYLHSWEYAELYNKALVNEGKKAIYSPEEIELFRKGTDPDNYPDTDWQGLFFKKNAVQHNHHLEVSGGDQNTNYMLSFGYMNQDGVIPLAQYDRYTARANINTKYKRFFAGINLSYVYRDIDEPSNPYTGDMYQILRQINRIAPFVTNKYSNGYYGYITDGNPMQWVDNGSLREEKYHTFRGVGNVGVNIIDGLKAQVQLGYEYNGNSDEKFIKSSQFYNWKTGAPTLFQGPNNQTDLRSTEINTNLQVLVTYDKTFGKHTVGALAGYSQEYERYDWTQGYRKNFLNNDIHELNAGSAEGQEATGSASEYSLQSLFGRVTYNYDNRYLFEANIRYDGTSRISPAGRWGVFPSFSAAWRVINEPFMSNAKNVLSDLKLRISWGKLGNQNIGNYPYQSVLSTSTYSFGGGVVTGVAPKNGANSNLKWETTENYNLGLDFGFLQNKLTVSTEFYYRHTYDILLQLPVSPLYGLSAPYQNAGEVANKGVELQLGYKFAKKDFTFNGVFNFSYNHNEVLDLKNDGARIWNGYSFKQEGYPINSLGGYEVLGIFQNQTEVDNSAVINRTQAAPGDLKYKDQNGDGLINGEDRVYLGSWSPSYLFGLNLSATYKGFDLLLQFNGTAGVKGYLQNETIGQLKGNTSKPTSLFRDSWDAETNPNGKFPRPLSDWSVNDSAAYPSSFWIIDASYLRLKNAQFGYSLPKNVIEALNISKLRIYYSGQNLLTFTKFNKGFDPEAPVGARAYYPQVRVHTFGLSITF